MLHWFSAVSCSYTSYISVWICIVLVQPTGSDVRPFQLTVEKLENSLKEAKKEVIFYFIFYLNIPCTRLKLTAYDSLYIGIEHQGPYPFKPPQSTGRSVLVWRDDQLSRVCQNVSLNCFLQALNQSHCFIQIFNIWKPVTFYHYRNIKDMLLQKNHITLFNVTQQMVSRMFMLFFFHMIKTFIEQRWGTTIKVSKMHFRAWHPIICRKNSILQKSFRIAWWWVNDEKLSGCQTYGSVIALCLPNVFTCFIKLHAIDEKLHLCSRMSFEFLPSAAIIYSFFLSYLLQAQASCDRGWDLHALRVQRDGHIPQCSQLGWVRDMHINPLSLISVLFLILICLVFSRKVLMSFSFYLIK